MNVSEYLNEFIANTEWNTFHVIDDLSNMMNDLRAPSRFVGTDPFFWKKSGVFSILCEFDGKMIPCLFAKRNSNDFRGEVTPMFSLQNKLKDVLTDDCLETFGQMFGKTDAFEGEKGKSTEVVFKNFLSTAMSGTDNTFRVCAINFLRPFRIFDNSRIKIEQQTANVEVMETGPNLKHGFLIDLLSRDCEKSVSVWHKMFNDPNFRQPNPESAKAVKGKVKKNKKGRKRTLKEEPLCTICGLSVESYKFCPEDGTKHAVKDALPAGGTGTAINKMMSELEVQPVTEIC